MKKVFYVMYGIGRSKYMLSYYNGISTHKDGSQFFNVELFKSKKKLEARIQELVREGYRPK